MLFLCEALEVIITYNSFDVMLNFSSFRDSINLINALCLDPPSTEYKIVKKWSLEAEHRAFASTSPTAQDVPALITLARRRRISYLMNK
jgi:hypothetical protein